MVSVSSSNSTSAYSYQRNLFSKLDSNSDDKVTKDEYVAGRPKNLSEAKASALYASIDTENTGSITETQLESAKPSGNSAASLFSSDAMAVLMLMSQQGGPPSASDIYAEMDADGDGSVTQAEFVSARPGDVSEEQATTLYASIDTEATGSITEEQFAESMPGPGGPPPGGAAPQGAQSDEESYDALDTNKDGTVSLEEFLAGRPEDVSEEQATSLFESLDTEGTGSITEEQFASLGSSGGPRGKPSAGGEADQLGQLLALLQSITASEETSTEAV